MRAEDFLPEAVFGTTPKRPTREGSRPARGHEPQPRYKHYCDACDRPKADCICDKTNEGISALEAELASIEESGKASRQLCKSSKPDAELGASQLASCKSQGLRARDGEKSHLIGHGSSSVRITVGGKKIKGKKYGGPLPDYGTRKGQ